MAGLRDISFITPRQPQRHASSPRPTCPTSVCLSGGARTCQPRHQLVISDSDGGKMYCLNQSCYFWPVPRSLCLCPRAIRDKALNCIALLGQGKKKSILATSLGHRTAMQSATLPRECLVEHQRLTLAANSPASLGIKPIQTPDCHHIVDE